MPEGDVTYYAKWTAIEYTITYNLDGGTNVSGNPAQYTVETGKITLVAPTKTGYRFDGWYTDDTYSTKVTEIAAGSTSDVTLYAKWTINQYTITWETNGGNDLTGSNYTTTADYGTAIVRPDDPTKKADAQYTYTFGGWYTDRALAQPLDDNATVPAENLTVYAKWNTTAQTYTVTWHIQKNPWWGSAKNDPYETKIETYPYGTLLLKNAPETTKDAYDAYYYELEGWRTGPETGELLTEASIVTGDAEYYPSFLQKKKMCTITFDLGDAGGDHRSGDGRVWNLQQLGLQQYPEARHHGAVRPVQGLVRRGYKPHGSGLQRADRRNDDGGGGLVGAVRLRREPAPGGSVGGRVPDVDGAPARGHRAGR